MLAHCRFVNTGFQSTTVVVTKDIAGPVKSMRFLTGIADELLSFTGVVAQRHPVADLDPLTLPDFR